MESTLFASEKKQKDEKKRGTKQMEDLLQAIQSGSLAETQGVNWKKSKIQKGCVSHFLESKLEKLKGAAIETNPFEYLRVHNIFSSQEEIEKCILSLVKTHKLCLSCKSESHPQIKLPYSKKIPSSSDKKNGKVIGLLQIQAYNVIFLLPEKKNESKDEERDEKLIENISNWIDLCPVGSHICKNRCITRGHVVPLSHEVNKGHDYCASYWVVHGKLINFCACKSKVKCIAPGPHFQSEPFKNAIFCSVNKTNFF